MVSGKAIKERVDWQDGKKLKAHCEQINPRQSQPKSKMALSHNKPNRSANRKQNFKMLLKKVTPKMG